MASPVTFLKALAVLLFTLACASAQAAPPVCRLLATPASVPAGAPVNLLAACTPDVSTFTWSNTGFSSNEGSGTVYPSVTSTYSVIGWNADGASNNASVTVTVTGPPLVPPTCTLTASATTVDPGTATILTANCSPTATSYSWSNGILNSSASVGTVYPRITTTYTLRASNAAGIGPETRLTVNVIVRVVDPPTCTLKASSDYVVPGGASVLTASCSPAASSYVWTNTGFSSSAASGTVHPLGNTTYSVRGTNEVGTGEAVAVSVAVRASPGSCNGGMVWTGTACACPAGQSFVDGQCFTPLPASSCGTERWAIKTGTDAGAAQVDARAVVPSTVPLLGSLALPANRPGAVRTGPVESTVYVVDALLTRYGMADDSDYHLVLSAQGAGADGKTLIARLPHPDCVGNASPFKSAITEVRNTFNAQFRTTRAFKTSSIPVRITGIGFIDTSAGQTGAALNGVQLHPVLKLDFNPSTAQGGDPAFPLASNATRLFNWAEAAYPDLFPKPASLGMYQQYSYRYYAGTGNYVATDPNGRVILHNGRDWNFLDIGAVTDLLPAAVQSGY